MNRIKQKMKILRTKRDWKDAKEVEKWFENTLIEVYKAGIEDGQKEEKQP